MDGQSFKASDSDNALTIRLNYFGVFNAEFSNGRAVNIRSMKARALLAYLALSPGMRRAREHLAALLWDRSDHEHARASLRQAVASLRKAFGPQSDQFILGDDPETISLNPSRFELDVIPGADDGDAGDRRTEFLSNLNVRSEPFEEWRRAKAACLTDDPDAGSSDREKADAAPLQEPHSAAESQRSSKAFSGGLAMRGAALPVYGVAGVLLLGAGVAAFTYFSVTASPTKPPELHGQNVVEITRQAAALRAYPQLAISIEQCKFDRMEPQSTIDACTRAIDVMSNDQPYKAIALTIRGTAYRWETKLDAATEDFAKAIIIDPDYYNAHHGLAYAYFLQGNYERALEHYGRVKEIVPVHIMAHFRTGEVYFTMEDYAKAVKAFDETIRLDPTSAYAYFYRAKSLIELGRINAAKDDLRMAASLSSPLRTEAEMLYAELSN